MSAKFAKKLLPTLIGSCLILEAAPVLAQLEEVVVSARKREETILQVPVTVSVLSAETLDQYAIDGVKGVADRTPGLNFGTGVITSGVVVSMRGIGTGTNNPAIDQSAALVVDGMQMTQGQAYKMATFDMTQVEVLKGPQALFFGKAAPAGVIAIRTADPTDETEVRLRAGYEFEAEEMLGEVVASGPVTDTLGLRVGVQYSDMNGYFENNAVASTTPFLGIPPVGDLGAAPVTNEDYPNKEELLLRGTALWNPTDDFSARFKLNYADMDSQGDGGDVQLVDCPEGTASLFSPFDLTGPDCDADDEQNLIYLDPASYPLILNGGVPFAETEQYFGTMELNYNLSDDLTLTSVTGYYDVDADAFINASVTTYYGTPFGIQGQLDRTEFTQELRLTSDFDGPVNFVVGGFYQDTETDYLSQLPVSAQWRTLVSLLQPGGRALPPLLQYADHEIDGDAKSLFGQVLWEFAPSWELGVGARWTNENRENYIFNLLPTMFGAPDGSVVNEANPKIGDDNWSPEVTLTWTPTDDLTFFGNLKQAFKSGGFDASGSPADGTDYSFEDERIRGGELGMKSRLLDSSLQFNLSTYYYEYDDMQVENSVFDPTSGNVGVRTTNAGSSEIYGVDADMSYAVPQVDGLVLYGAVNWNIAEYDEFSDADCWLGQLWQEGCNIDLNGDGRGDAQDLSGEKLLRAPEWAANFGFDYAFPVSENGMTMHIGSNTNWSDEYMTSSQNYEGAYQDSYWKTSATVGLAGADDSWVVELIGDNLTDEYTYGKCSPTGYANGLIFGTDKVRANNGGTSRGQYGLPEVGCNIERGRSVWVRLTLNY